MTTMKRFFMSCVGAISLFFYLSSFAHAQEVTWRYTQPVTKKMLTITRVSALRDLQAVARVVTQKQFASLTKAPEKQWKNRLFVVKGQPDRLWYVSREKKPLYFDGAARSFDLLRTQMALIPIVSDQRFTYKKDKGTYIVTLDLSKGIQMEVTTGHDSIRPTDECRYPKYCKAEARAEPFVSFVKRLSGAPLVLNGGYFDAYSKPLNEQNYHTVSSDLIMGGEMKSMYGWDKAWGDGGMIAQKKDGSFAFYYPIRDWIAEADKIQTAVSNYPLVLLHDVVKTKDEMVMADPNDRKFWLSARRGGLGLSADGARLVYVSIVGTVEDLGAALHEAGAANGFALDAGGSNGFAYEGKTIFTPGRKLTSVISFR